MDTHKNAWLPLEPSIPARAVARPPTTIALASAIAWPGKRSVGQVFPTKPEALEHPLSLTRETRSVGWVKPLRDPTAEPETTV